MPASNVSETEDLESLTEDLRRHSRSTSAQSVREARCCCGRENCAFLRRSQELISSLEKDVQTAATLGQALLQRHERSIAEAQREVMTMARTITALESKTTALELENSKTIEENKSLLASLEDANTEMTLCERRMKNLQAKLDTTHAEFSSVSAAAARTEVLEAQLAVLESEQVELRNLIATTKEEEKIAKLRSQKAERSVRELEQQLDRIEREHALEKARAANMLERLEPRKYTGQQAAPYLSALADRTALNRFMKEIMAENSHLQYGVAELKDMLQASQEEATLLREQLQMLDQENTQLKSPLSRELTRDSSPAGFQTIIHHHHYHPVANKEKPKPQIRKPKKRRNVTGDHFTSPVVQGSSKRQQSPIPASSPTSQVWSPITQPTTTSPSSPVSTFHESSIFDLRNGQESSRPTSADSNFRTLTYPKRPSHAHNSSAASGPPFSILHTNEEEPEPESPLVRPRGLHRSISHESLFSVDSPFVFSPDMPSSAFSGPSATRSPALASTATMGNGPQARITPGIAIRSPSGSHGSSAYSRLLGLQQETKPFTSRSPGSETSGTANKTPGSWFWRWGTGSSPNDCQKKSIVRGKKVPTTPAVLSGYIDEELLKDALNDGSV